MFGNIRIKHDKKIQSKLKEMGSLPQPEVLCGTYDEKLEIIKSFFQDDEQIGFREIYAGKKGELRACLISCDGMVDAALIDNHLIRPLIRIEKLPKDKTSADAFLSRTFEMLKVQKTNQAADIIQGITSGDTLVLMECLEEGLLFETKGFELRAISEPEGEKIISGPREGFTESLVQNLSMVRRKFQTEKLKVQFVKTGKTTNTKIGIAYLDKVADPEVLRTLQSRLAQIDIDGILDANYINELIRDQAWTPFRTTGYTERPDVVAAKLLEGRIAVFTDGTPVVLTVPYLFIENFQSNEDYYLNFYYSTFSRILRILGFFLTTMLPAVYIAIVAFHQEILPSPLLISVAAEQQSVPLPAALEALIMLVVFEILRETALRMQTNVGQALSIVGALVVGQAAVEARLVAAPMLIIIAMAGITSLLIPKMNSPILLIRFGTLLMATCLGFLGVTISCVFILGHVLCLHSFGVWQFAADRPISLQKIKDTALRVPWSEMLFRPSWLTNNIVRQQKNRKGE